MAVFRVLDFIEWEKLLKLLYTSAIKLRYIPRTRKYSRIVGSLCKQHNIKIEWFLQTEKNGKASANPTENSIKIPFPNTIVGFTAAMHEIGHLVHYSGAEKINMWESLFAFSETTTEELKREICAWLWAVRNTPVKLDKNDLVYALNSYLKHASDKVKKNNLKILLRLDRLAGTEFARA